MPWYFFAAVSVTGISLFNWGIKHTGSQGAHPIFLNALLLFVAAVSAFTYASLRVPIGQNIGLLSGKDVAYIAIAGVGSMMINLGYGEMYARGAPVSIGANTVLMASLLAVTLLGVVVFREALTPMKVAGILLAAASLICFMKG